MLKSYKTEISLSEYQKVKVRKTIGVARYVYNMYLNHNIENYKRNNTFITAYTFSKWLNNDFIPNNIEYSWIKEVYAKSTKQSILNAEKAFKKFFKGESKFPRFKKKNKSDVKMYFVKNSKTQIIKCERHRIFIPSLKWVKLKEKGYIPTNHLTHIIKSGTVSEKAGRFYVSVLVEEPDYNDYTISQNKGIGIDLGIKDFAIISNGVVYKNINKSTKIRKLEKKLKREQRILSKKININKRKNEKEESVAGKNIHKQIVKVQRIHQKLSNIRNDYQNKIVRILVKAKPEYITIENLNIRGMMKNRHLAKSVAQQMFNNFKNKIINKAKFYNIEVREVNTFYPSSKLCSCCGHKKKSLKLSERIYHCKNCGLEIDRDLNASINLANAKEYRVLT